MTRDPWICRWRWPLVVLPYLLLALLWIRTNAIQRVVEASEANRAARDLEVLVRLERIYKAIDQPGK